MQTSAKTRTKGFALLITVTLLAFLVLLLVSLASLTRVETQVASNNQNLAQARQNALMALNIALGELQKYTGPDQRTTARSDMDSTLANTTTASGRWLGAYGSGAAADYTMNPSAVGTAVVNASDTKGSQAKLLNWLVSGNESTPFSPSAHMGATGNIATPPSVFQFTPNGAVTNLTAASTALSDTITITDKDNAAQPARLLVGSNTTGNSPADYVVAPLKTISAVSPGLGTTAVPVGRYAWWVGDEGAKARVNLPMATSTQAAYAFVSSQRAAVELVDAVNPSASTSLASGQMLDPTGTTSRYDPNNPLLVKLLSPDQLPMLSAAAATTLSTVAKYRHHDLTVWSTSVLSDTYAGGLKKDLSAVLAKLVLPATHASPHADNDFIFKPEPNAGSFTSNEFGVPTWGQLRSFAQKTTAATGQFTVEAPGMVKISGRIVPTPTNTSIAPVMTYATIGFCYGVRISAPVGPDTTLPSSPLTVDLPGTPIRLGAFPVVVLWNPYATDISPAIYEVGFRKRGSANFELQAGPVGTTATSTNPPAWSFANVIEQKTLDGYISATDPYLRFLVETPVIPAGQSLVFTLNTTDIEFQQSDYACRLTYGYRRLNHVLLPRAAGSAATITTPHQIYRVGANGSGTIWSGAPRTYFTSAGTLNFGNSDYSYSYLRLINSTVPASAIPPPATFPKTYDPYDNTAANPGLDILQWLGEFRPEGQYGAAPYGYAAGYSKFVSPSNEPTNALLRNEGEIGMISEPTFWLPFTMRFNNADTRWLAMGNPRSMFVSSPPPPSGSTYEPTNWLASPQNYNWPPGLNVIGGVSTPRAHAGVALNSSATTATDVVLYDFRPHNQPLLSIGQLQHANLSWLPDNPSYAVGNSAGNIYLNGTPSALIRQRSGSGFAGATAKTTTIYDSSWLLNRVLWDQYFISSVPNAGTGTATDTASVALDPLTPLPNPRHLRYGSPSDTTLRDISKASTGLVLAGGFNINSTSEQAWRAVLAGVNRLSYDPVNPSGPPIELRAALSRFTKPQSAPPATLTNANVWTGYRMLDEAQIAQLAQSIVTEIRSRGPSISLADFINRRLVDTGAFPQTNDKRLSGTIQAAIENTASTANPVNSATAAPYTNLVPAPPSWQGSMNPFKAGSGTSVAPRSARAAYAPQYLTQADVFSTLGSSLSARSDTFVVRTYGDVLDAVNSTSPAPVVNARAWCEAVVQRLPDFTDMSDPALLASGNATNPSITNATNKSFGRRYKVISFRWLTPSDI